MPPTVRSEYHVEGSGLTIAVPWNRARFWSCLGSAPAAPELDEGSAKTEATMEVEAEAFHVSFPE